MLRPGFDSIVATWFAALLALLPLALTAAVLAWALNLIYEYLGPASLIGRLFAALGDPYGHCPSSRRNKYLGSASNMADEANQLREIERLMEELKPFHRANNDAYPPSLNPTSSGGHSACRRSPISSSVGRQRKCRLGLQAPTYRDAWSVRLFRSPAVVRNASIVIPRERSFAHERSSASFRHHHRHQL
jgi:hypothetical protein